MKSPHEDRWEFRSAQDVQRFWEQYRTVPGRMDGRRHHDEERYCLGLYLLALAEHKLLTYPLRVEQCGGDRSPDFMVTWPSGEITGLEVTRATERWLQRVMEESEKESTKGELEAAVTPKEPEPVFIPLSELGWAGDQVETEWCSLFKSAIEKKLRKLSAFTSALRHDLLVYDDTPLPAIDREKVLSVMHPYIRHLQDEHPELGKISFIVSLDLIFDVGGECRMFPYIEWSNLKPDDPESLMAVARRAEQAGQAAVKTVLQRKKVFRKLAAMGRAVHFIDRQGRRIKQMPDGRRFEVKILDDGKEVVLKEL
jgi:hypothetical protein